MNETAVPPEVRLPSFDAPADSPFSWLHDVAATVRKHLSVRGAVLVHGLPLTGPSDLAEAREAMGIGIHTPTEAFTPRSDFGNGVLSPIDWPNERSLCPFQENSFSTNFPSVVLTACVTPPDSGQAYLSDARRVMDRLPARLADRVRTDGWSMTRVFHRGFGLSPQDAFSVTDRTELEKVLEAAEIEYEWLPGGSLRTARRRSGVVEHPTTGEECWFNQLAFLNDKSLDPTEREVMAKSFGEDLPMNTSFGDGSPLPKEDWAAILRAYDSAMTAVSWRRGDLLIVDNVITAQGRSSFEGSPEFLVALGEGFEP